MPQVSLVFLDTNILVYRHDPSDTAKRQTANDWIAALAHARRGRLSWQVLNEYYAVAMRKLQDHGLAAGGLRLDVRSYSAWHPLGPSLALFERAWAVQDSYQLPWWDALIVAAALQLECSTLLSEDMQHGLIVDSQLRIVNPFAADAPPPPLH